MKLIVYADNKEEIILALSKIQTDLEAGFLSCSSTNWDLQGEE